jgi:hypothetical protein
LIRKETASLNLKFGPAVDAGEAHAVDLPVHGHDHPGLARSALGVARLVQDATVLEDRHVELGGLLGLGVEPEVGCDLLFHTG